jgi:hypothetical protein
MANRPAVTVEKSLDQAGAAIATIVDLDPCAFGSAGTPTVTLAGKAPEKKAE